MDLAAISDVFGIWRAETGSNNVYVLRKDPALLYLQPHELGLSFDKDSPKDNEEAGAHST